MITAWPGRTDRAEGTPMNVPGGISVCNCSGMMHVDPDYRRGLLKLALVDLSVKPDRIPQNIALEQSHDLVPSAGSG